MIASLSGCYPEPVPDAPAAPDEIANAAALANEAAADEAADVNAFGGNAAAMDANGH